METKKRPAKNYSPEVRERAVKMVLEHEADYENRRAAICSIAAKFGCHPKTLALWLQQIERDQRLRAGATSEEKARIKALERENRELRQANEILRKASAYFCPGGARPPSPVMTAFIDKHREVYGVEPICKVLPIAPSTYYLHAARKKQPSLLPARQVKDIKLSEQIRKIWDANFKVYGAVKIWHQLKREGITVARCTVERLMRTMGLQGIRRGKGVKTTFSNQSAPCPDDLVNRNFQADRPNALWVADYTFCTTYQGFVYTAFIIDVFSRYIVGWRVSSSAKTDFVLDALEQALYARRPFKGERLIHHSDRGSQYVSIRYTERMVEAGIECSVGSVGDSYDNALAETINGLYKSEVIHRQSWQTRAQVEMATLKWVAWFNQQRLLGPIGYIPPVEAEIRYYQQQIELDKAA
ncbi:MAG: IS3 family transposase [Candidatus Symbiodolus clandestinus]